MKEFIKEGLSKYISDNPYPWHMPGHKRRSCFGTAGADEYANIGNDRFAADSGRWQAMFAYDFTEAKGLDDMHKPEAFIKDSLQQLSSIYGTYKTYMLVNGATSGILAAVHACCNPGNTVLMARNCHKSVYNAVGLLRLRPYYLRPAVLDGTDIMGDITPEEVERLLACAMSEGNKPSAVILTSPTYEGIVSDIQGISDILKEYDIPLIVDEAHGAHLCFMGEDGPAPAIKYGADFVIESVHKTLPSLTQTAVLHLMSSRYEKRLERYLQIFQTSSPSYLFMQSIEKAVCYCSSMSDDFKMYRERLENFRNKCGSLEHLSLFYPDKRVYDYDRGKLVIQICHGSFYTYDGMRKHLTGALLQDILMEEYGQALEMASKDYVVAMTSVMDCDEAFDKLYNVLKEIDSRISFNDEEKFCEESRGYDEEQACVGNRDCKLPKYIPEMGILPGEAWNRESFLVKLEDSEGYMAAEYIYAYPPGIPVTAPGEIISGDIIADIKNMLAGGLSVTGICLSQETARIAVIGG